MFIQIYPISTSIFSFIESEEVFSQIIVNSLATTLQEIVEQIKKKRAHLFRPIPQGDLDQYLRLELRSKPGVALDLQSRIGDYVEHGPSGSHGQAANMGSVNFSLKFTNQNLGTSTGGQRKISGNFLDVTDAAGGAEGEISPGSFKGRVESSGIFGF